MDRNENLHRGVIMEVKFKFEISNIFRHLDVIAGQNATFPIDFVRGQHYHAACDIDCDDGSPTVAI